MKKFFAPQEKVEMTPLVVKENIWMKFVILCTNYNLFCKYLFKIRSCYLVFELICMYILCIHVL